jgi:hypothetical protein
MAALATRAGAAGPGTARAAPPRGNPWCIAQRRGTARRAACSDRNKQYEPNQDQKPLRLLQNPKTPKHVYDDCLTLNYFRKTRKFLDFSHSLASEVLTVKIAVVAYFSKHLLAFYSVSWCHLLGEIVYSLTNVENGEMFGTCGIITQRENNFHQILALKHL